MTITEEFMKMHQELLNTNSRTKKEEILKKFSENEEIVRVLEFVFDPMKSYFLSADFSGSNTGNGERLMNCDRLEAVLDQVIQRRGDAAKEYLSEIFERHDPLVEKMIRIILSRDLKAGVGIKTIKKAIPYFRIEEFIVMKGDSLYDSEGNMQKIDINFPAVSEIKWDGYRCTVYVDNEMVRFWSSEGKLLNELPVLAAEVRKVQESLKESFPKSSAFILDGEIVACNLEDGQDTFSATQSIVTKLEPYEGEDIILKVFAMMPFKHFEKSREVPLEHFTTSRLRRLVKQVLERVDLQFISRANGKKVENLEEALAHMKELSQKGYEGTMIKDFDQPYYRKRVKGWIKAKFFDFYDAVITGTEEGKGKHKGALGKFICDFEGVEVRVGGSFKQSLTDEKRKAFWKMREQLVDLKIKVRAYGKTQAGSLRHPALASFHEVTGVKLP